MMDTLRLVLTAAVVAYVVLFTMALLLGDRLIFPAPPASYEPGDHLHWLRAPDGKRIAALHLLGPPGSYTVLYSHGNGEDLGTIRPALELLREEGLSVLAYDYRGYGLSEGRAGVASAIEDIDAAYAYLVQELGVPPERIILYGRSVGGGPSVDLAARQPVGGLILESTFATAFTVATRLPLLPFDRLPNIRLIERVRCPVLVIHSEDDRTIPFSHGKRLYERAPEPKRALWLADAGHNDLLATATPRYAQAIREFVALLEGEPAPG